MNAQLECFDATTDCAWTIRDVAMVDHNVRTARTKSTAVRSPLFSIYLLASFLSIDLNLIRITSYAISINSNGIGPLVIDGRYRKTIWESPGQIDISVVLILNVGNF